MAIAVVYCTIVAEKLIMMSVLRFIPTPVAK